jgi:outer membrane protein OmpA-like peptidoglycan-associated protein
MQKYLVEFIGTFFLVLTIALAVASGSSLAPLAIAAGLMVMVYMGGHISGAHYNPAVTLAVFMRGKCAAADVGPYIAAQLLGAFAAGALGLFVSQKIFFAFGSTKILPRSDPLLDEVAQALKDRAGICVRVEGHTDNKGSREQNMTLSEGRAAAVRDYLLVTGVDAPRLTAKGYADTLPIDSNGTLEGRENNRRVEFVIGPCPGEAK